MDHVHAGWASQASKDPSLFASSRSEISDKLEGELARGEVNTGPIYESSALLGACRSEGKGGQGGAGKHPAAADIPTGCRRDGPGDAAAGRAGNAKEPSVMQMERQEEPS